MRRRLLFISAFLVWSCLLSIPLVDAAEAGKIVCVQCHGTLAGRLGEPVRLWRGSIHAENGIACNGCHGGDPQDAANAMSPSRGFLGAPKEKDIPAFCGRCHPGVLKDYVASAHGMALGMGGPTCVSCHGNHHVVKATLELINEQSCSRCHSFERARIIKAAMEETEKLIGSIGGRIGSYKEKGFDVDRLEKGLFALRNRFHSLFHNVDAGKVRTESGQIRIELRKLEATLDTMDGTRHRRRLIGGIAVIGALLGAALLHLLRRTFA